MQEFIKELRSLLAKHKAEIGFDCGEGSDTHGIYGEHMYIEVDGKTVEFNGWSIDSSDF